MSLYADKYPELQLLAEVAHFVIIGEATKP
jgi:hypothetical protein